MAELRHLFMGALGPQRRCFTLETPSQRAGSAAAKLKILKLP
jgi:hypothetical protein